MKEYFSAYFGKFFNTQVVVQDYTPVYRANFLVYDRSFFSIQIKELKFIVAVTAKNEVFKISQYLRQQETFLEHDKMNVVFYFNSVSFAQQEAFINNHVPFMTAKGHVFIPFVGLQLKGNVSADRVLSSEKMMPATQKIFLELIYSKEDEIKCSNLDKKLKISKMSVTRGCEQLKTMELIEMEIRGRTGFIRSKYKGLELYAKAKDKLINPIQETLLIPENELPEKSVIAGETLLGKLTMLNPPSVKQYAIYKGDINRNILHPQNVRWNKTDGLVYLQLWKYEPELFFQKNEIDPVSLACSLSEIFDERVEGEVDDLLGAFEW